METLFGFEREQIESFFMSFGLAAFMLYMVFIIVQLAVESKAGKYGLAVLSMTLGAGMAGFAIKGGLARFMGL